MTGTLLTASEVCERLSVSKAWLSRAARDGLIPSIRLGEGPRAPLRFVEEDVDTWLEQARQAWRPGQSSPKTLRRSQETS